MPTGTGCLSLSHGSPREDENHFILKMKPILFYLFYFSTISAALNQSVEAQHPSSSSCQRDLLPPCISVVDRTPQSHVRSPQDIRAPQAQSLPASPLLCPPAVAVPVFGSDVRHDVLVEEFQDQRDAVGKHQVLGHVLKLGRRRERGQR